MTPKTDDAVELSTNGHGRVKVSLPIKAAVGILVLLLGGYGWARPYLGLEPVVELQPSQPTAAPQTVPDNRDMVAALTSLIGNVKTLTDTVAGVDRRLVVIETTLTFQSQALRDDRADIARLQQDTARLQGRAAQVER